MKKILALLCSAIMAMTALPAYADTATLEDVTLSVKETLGISDDYTDFSGNSYNSGYWELYWNSDSEHINVTCSDSGKIFMYNHYKDYDYSAKASGVKFPAADTDAILAAAESFLTKVLDENEFYMLTNIDNSLDEGYSPDCYVNFRLCKNGYPTDASLWMSISPETLECTYFNRSDYDYSYAAETPLPDVKVKDTDAIAQIMSMEELELKYIVVNYGDMARLCYVRKDGTKYGVDASSGEMFDLNGVMAENSLYNTAMDGGGESDYAEARSTLTEAELEGISVYDNAKSVDELDAMARAIAELGLTDEYAITEASYYDNDDGLVASLQYSREIPDSEMAEIYGFTDTEIASVKEYSGNFIDKRIVLSADTGKLESMYTTRPYTNKKVDEVDPSAYKEIAEKFADANFSERYSESELTEQDGSGNSYYGISVAKYTFTRKHSGYLFDDNYLSISVNALDGTIEECVNLWSGAQEFCEPDDIELVTPESAFETYSAARSIELSYVSVPVAEERYGYAYEERLCYHFASDDTVYGVDAETGEILDYSYDVNPIIYDDISGIDEEDSILKLASYGIGFIGDSFMPDMKLTAWDAVSLLFSVKGYGSDFISDFSSVTDAAKYIGVTSFIGLGNDHVITRRELASALIDLSGWTDAARIEGIYACSFADDAKIDKSNYGYVALAYGLGIIEKDTEGNINPDTELTRAQAAVMISLYLAR